MTNYFKVYLKGNKGTQRYIFKKKEEVIAFINKANKLDYYSYLIIKRLKQGTDVTIDRGTFDKTKDKIFIKNLDKDWRVVDNMVVDWSKYKKHKEER